MQFHDYVFDKNCNISTPKKNIPYMVGNIFGGKLGDMKINSACHENLVENIINLIISKDPNGIIIVQSDHGPWYWRFGYSRRVDFNRGYGIFSAMRLPNINVPPEIQDYLKSSPSPVNDFRIVFALLADKKPELLPYEAFVYDTSTGNITNNTKMRYKEE